MRPSRDAHRNCRSSQLRSRTSRRTERRDGAFRRMSRFFGDFDLVPNFWRVTFRHHDERRNASSFIMIGLGSGNKNEMHGCNHFYMSVFFGWLCLLLIVDLTNLSCLICTTYVTFHCAFD